MDSQWELEHPGGKFNIEFRANTAFVLDFPAHSHWSLTNDETPTPLLYINWSRAASTSKSLQTARRWPAAPRSKPDNWRKARRLGSWRSSGCARA